MTEESPIVRVQMRIRRPVREVFAAFVDPAITTRFWFTKSSGPLVQGAEVTWSNGEAETWRTTNRLNARLLSGSWDYVVVHDRLVPQAVNIKLYRALLESVASEHGARMSAMENATSNASDMIASLTLTYNRTRQAVITKELMEIVSGAEALK